MSEKLLNSVAATGVSAGRLLQKPISSHTVHAWFVDANDSVSEATLALEISLDPSSVSDANAKWIQIAEYDFNSAEITAKEAIFHVNQRVAQRIRLNLTAFDGSGADRFSARYQEGVI